MKRLLYVNVDFNIESYEGYNILYCILMFQSFSYNKYDPANKQQNFYSRQDYLLHHYDHTSPSLTLLFHFTNLMYLYFRHSNWDGLFCTADGVGGLFSTPISDP